MHRPQLQFVGLLVLILAGCSQHAAPRKRPPAQLPRIFALTENGQARGFDENYSGRWEFVRNLRDGRFRGTSARSFHTGDSLSFIFAGSRFRVYGVTGPKGGDGVLSIVGAPTTLISFYSPVKRTHALLYTSPRLPNGVHAAAIVVAGSHEPKSHGAYVNIDSVEIENVKESP